MCKPAIIQANFVFLWTCDVVWCDVSVVLCRRREKVVREKFLSGKWLNNIKKWCMWMEHSWSESLPVSGQDSVVSFDLLKDPDSGLNFNKTKATATPMSQNSLNSHIPIYICWTDVWCSISSYADVVPGHCEEEGGQPEGSWAERNGCIGWMDEGQIYQVFLLLFWRL